MGTVVVALLAAVAGYVLARLARRPVQISVTQDGWHAFHAELDRSRRYERPFALVRFERPTPDTHLRTAIDAALRAVDSVWEEGQHVYALLPECGRAEGAAFIERLKATMPGNTLPGGTRTAVFPDDGLTTGALLALLSEATISVIDRTGPTNAPSDSRATGHGAGPS